MKEMMPRARISSRCSSFARPPGDHLVGEMRQQDGLAGANHVMGADRRRGIGRILARERPRELDPRGIGVRQGELLQLAAAVEDVHRAPVGDLGHRHLRDGLQRLVVVERRRQGRRGAGEKQRPLVAAGSAANGARPCAARRRPGGRRREPSRSRRPGTRDGGGSRTPANPTLPRRSREGSRASTRCLLSHTPRAGARASGAAARPRRQSDRDRAPRRPAAPGAKR